MNMDDSPAFAEITDEQIASAHANAAATVALYWTTRGGVWKHGGRALVAALALRLSLPVLNRRYGVPRTGVRPLPLAKALQRGAVLLRDPNAGNGGDRGHTRRFRSIAAQLA